MLDICIIGGGAAAMVAAIAAATANPNLRICILEKKESLGKKLLATGNGKCNLSNAACFNVKQTLEFFGQIGVITRQDEAGRIYPYDEQAKEVVYGLRRQLDILNITVKTDCEVSDVGRVPEGFVISHKGGQVIASKLLIATGGKAGPQYGATGDGYRFAKKFGHTVKKTAPILTAVETEKNYSSLKGIRVKGKAALLRKGSEIAEATGEVQITGDGLSGICIFDLSRFVKLDSVTSFTDYTVEVDLLPSMTEEQVINFLTERKSAKGLIARDLLLSITARPLALYLLGQCHISSEPLASEISETQIISLAKTLKGWKTELSGLKGWKFAQCTSGGVALDELDLNRMESNLIKDLYFAGEVIDFDGPCGGYNLQNAWETGIKAGKAMANV